MTKTSFAVAILLALTMPANAAERASVLEGARSATWLARPKRFELLTPDS